MKHFIAFLALVTVPLTAWSDLDLQQTGSETESVTLEDDKVTISAKGIDIRSVLYDLFAQTGNNFIIDDGVRHVLYLNLAKVEFNEALYVVLKHGDLGFEVDGNIYYIGKNRAKNYASLKPPKTVVTPPKLPEPKEEPEARVEIKKTGKLTDVDLQKARLTTRLTMVPIRDVFKEFEKQTQITIEVDESVPRYKIDAFLLDTSLKYALDVVVEATGLEYVKTDFQTILIRKKKTEE